jgi:hypothetical protein
MFTSLFTLIILSAFSMTELSAHTLFFSKQWSRYPVPQLQSLLSVHTCLYGWSVHTWESSYYLSACLPHCSSVCVWVWSGVACLCRCAQISILSFLCVPVCTCVSMVPSLPLVLTLTPPRFVDMRWGQTLRFWDDMGHLWTQWKLVNSHYHLTRHYNTV